jgi:hypothetical protein
MNMINREAPDVLKSSGWVQQRQQNFGTRKGVLAQQFPPTPISSTKANSSEPSSTQSLKPFPEPNWDIHHSTCQQSPAHFGLVGQLHTTNRESEGVQGHGAAQGIQMTDLMDPALFPLDNSDPEQWMNDFGELAQ